MDYDSFFDSEENKALLAISARRMIRNIGIGAVLWGLFNLLICNVHLSLSIFSISTLTFGLLLLLVGFYALKNPTLKVFLGEAIIAIFGVVWEVGVSFYISGRSNPVDIIFSIAVASFFIGTYKKLDHVKEQIATVAPEKIKTTKAMSKALMKKKTKNDPAIVQSACRKCRAQLMDGRAFFIQRDMMRAFVGTITDVRKAVLKSDAKKLKMVFNYPLGKLKYGFDRKNSEKLKSWFATEGPVSDVVS